MANGARKHRWDAIPKERLNDLLERRLVTGERMMLAHVYLKKGCLVPRHAHENEQITYVLEGALHFWLGEDEKEECVIRAGEVLTIPPNLPHKALALEDLFFGKNVGSALAVGQSRGVVMLAAGISAGLLLASLLLLMAKVIRLLTCRPTDDTRTDQSAPGRAN